MRTLALALALLVAMPAFAGCTDKISFNSASVDEGKFSLTPDKGDARTLFKVDAGKLGEGKNVTWDFGDGTVRYGGSAEHKYGFTNGVMTITLLVTGSDGKQSVATRTVKLGTGENAEPNVTVRASKTWIEMRKPVNLTATTRDADKDPIRHLWTYKVLEGGASGDGHAHSHGDAPAATNAQEFVIDGEGAKTQAVFDAPGKYEVRVRASDPKGGQSVATVVVDVSRHIPEPRMSLTFQGTLTAGTGGQGASVSDTLWGTPAPDSNVDAARHPYTLLYPATTFVMVTWNDTSTQGVFDLDLEVRDANTGEVVFTSATRAPAPAFESNMTRQEPGDYVVVIKAVAGAQVAYTVQLVSALELTPARVAAVEGA